MISRAELDLLYRYAFTLSADEGEAYALLQAALERYLGARQSVEIRAAVPYVRQTIRNIFIDQRRRQRRFAEEPLDEQSDALPDSSFELEDQVIASVELERIWSTLTPLQREVLYLWAVEGRTASEIAIGTGAPRGTVLARIHRIRQRLRADRAEPAPRPCALATGPRVDRGDTTP